MNTVLDPVARLAERRLDDRAYIVVFLNSVKIGSQHVIAAAGVDREGNKRLLGVGPCTGVRGERMQAAAALLRDMVRRGLPTGRRRLFVTDGSRELSRAIVEVLGPDFFVQRCRTHFIRVVSKSIRGIHRPSVRTPIRIALDYGLYGGEQELHAFADRLLADGQAKAAATLLDSLDHVFTVDKLELAPKLRRSLSTTNVVCQARHRKPSQIGATATSPQEDTAVRRAAATLLEAEKGFARIAGRHHLQILKDHLDQLELLPMPTTSKPRSPAP